MPAIDRDCAFSCILTYTFPSLLNTIADNWIVRVSHCGTCTGRPSLLTGTTRQAQGPAPTCLTLVSCPGTVVMHRDTQISGIPYRRVPFPGGSTAISRLA